MGRRDKIGERKMERKEEGSGGWMEREKKE